MSSEQKHGDGLLERMFSGIGHVSEVLPTPAPHPAVEPYRPLRQSKAGSGVTYRLPSRTPELRVQASSPATDVMTDLSRVAAVTIAVGDNVDEAQQAMHTHRVRALFVINDARAILGVITANDLSGEKPIQIAQNRGVRHADVLVSDVMTPANLLEAMELQDVQQVRVGDVVETLKRSGRQHALVIETGPAEAPAATRTVRGIISLTQIARQLGLPPQVGYNVARTFAEIEAAIGA
ncbi:MAG: CBS domain-containing protein [Betaproteobacteria bacterium]